MARIDSFLRLVVQQQASDLHFHAGNVPLIRYQKDLVPLPFRVVSDEESRRFLYEILDEEQKRILEQEQQVDLAYEVPGHARFRVNVFQKLLGVGAVFRIIPQSIATMEQLGLPPVLRRLCSLGSGLVLVTGPTGSGKTTTLASIIQEINRTTKRHIITIEDPIEFVHKNERSVVTQRQVGLHAHSLSTALRSALRESPDVVVVGELRDRESVQLALSAAETGVLVFGTLHTGSAAKAVDRLIDICGADETQDQVRGMISVLMRAVVAQSLCKRASADGLVAACEVLLNSYAVAHMIRDGKVHQIDGHLQTVEHSTGMQSLDGCLLRYVRDGVITAEEALRVANHPDVLRDSIRALPPEA
jgi:twitching motility protein PilT